MSDSTPFTATELIAAATEFLVGGGYSQVPSDVCEPYDLAGARVFEDPYGVAAIVIFDTWEDLASTWPDYQSGLVDLMSSYVPSVEPKAWEAYLVLLTPGGLGDTAHAQAGAIRYDMTRVRKLVEAGAELRTLSDLERVLRPLLPLQPEVLSAESASALDLLPDLVSSDDLPEDAVRIAIEAFKASKPIVDALYQWGVER